MILTSLDIPVPAAVAIGMPGARTDAQRDRIRHAAAQIWPAAPCYATNDLETALMAADELEAATAARGSASTSFS